MNNFLYTFLVILIVMQSCVKRSVPTITTLPITSSGISIHSGGEITTDGGRHIIAKGICWSTETNPTINNDTTFDGMGDESFESEITGFKANTTYFVRAYATNSEGTGYGNELTFNNQIDIGQTFQGGIIFYLDENGGGLIAASNDQAISAEWGCFETEINGADGVELGTGYQNTLDMLQANCQPNISGNLLASEVCESLVIDGYSDWFLPSKDELNLMYNNIGNGNALGLGNVGNFALDFYWSSTEINSHYAEKQLFSTGFQGNYCKFGKYHVRAIRAF